MIPPPPRTHGHAERELGEWCIRLKPSEGTWGGILRPKERVSILNIARYATHPLTLFVFMRALNVNRLRCPHCGRRLKVIPASKLNLTIAFAYLMLSCLSLLLGLRLCETFQAGLLVGVAIYLFVFIPLVKLLVSLYISRSRKLRIACRLSSKN